MQLMKKCMQQGLKRCLAKPNLFNVPDFRLLTKKCDSSPTRVESLTRVVPTLNNSITRLITDNIKMVLQTSYFVMGNFLFNPELKL